MKYLNTSRKLSNKHQNRKTPSLTSSLKFGQYIYMGLYSNSQFNIKVSGGRGTDYIKWQFTEINVIELQPKVLHEIYNLHIFTQKSVCSLFLDYFKRCFPTGEFVALKQSGTDCKV